MNGAPGYHSMSPDRAPMSPPPEPCVDCTHDYCRCAHAADGRITKDEYDALVADWLARHGRQTYAGAWAEVARSARECGRLIIEAIRRR